VSGFSGLSTQSLKGVVVTGLHVVRELMLQFWMPTTKSPFVGAAGLGPHSVVAQVLAASQVVSSAGPGNRVGHRLLLLVDPAAGLDLGGGGASEGGAAAVELAEGDSCFAFLAACCKLVLRRPVVAQLFHWNAGDHHALPAAGRQLTLRADRQSEQGIQLSPAGEPLELVPGHLLVQEK